MQWVGTWGCAQYCGDDTGDEGKASALAVSRTLSGNTLRQIIRTSAGGAGLRLIFSNEYGQTPMELSEVRIAKALIPAGPDIDILTDTSVTFGGSKSAGIAPGETIASDAIGFEAKALERIAVSICFGQVPRHVACHVGARANSFIARGSAVSDAVMGGAAVCTHWFALSGIDIYATPGHESIVVLGDSITDGYGVAGERYSRWTDVLAAMLQQNPETRHLSVVNMGIGTNRLLDQINPPAAIDRFERDVLSRDGVGYFIFLIGVNDLAESAPDADCTPDGNSTLTGRMIAAYRKMIATAGAKGIKTYGCTIPPYWYSDSRRHEINDWLRRKNRQGLDGLIDFDALIRDPKNPERMLRHFDNDGMHPAESAYAAMGKLAYTTIAGKTEI